MQSIHRVHFCGLAVVILSVTGLTAKELPKKERFVPNYVTIRDVTLSSQSGTPRGMLTKGTPVVARAMGELLEVKSQDGSVGVANSKFFSRLGNNIKITDAAKQVAQSNNKFAFALYQQARLQEGNLFLSPASVSTALAMTYAGSGGVTRQEMASVLHLDPDQRTHEGFSTLLALLNSTGHRNGYALATANRLWGADGYRFEGAFLQLTRDKYRAELEAVSFRRPEQARQIINSWVERQTRARIVNLIPSGVLQSDTRLVLTNAIYFSGGWSSKFSKKATKLSPFHLTATNKINVLTMHIRKDFPYTEDADAQILAMPYRGGELSMVVVLPKKDEGLAELEANLANDRFNVWMKNLRSDRPVITYLPKYRMRSQLMLADALKSLGMESAFSDNADFSAMSKSENLKISEVVHQAFVDVDEEGTEAAAATAVRMGPTARVRPKGPPKPVVFRADHPFLFMIRDNRTGALLFMGRVHKPEL